jgi:hypothetical protein
VQAAFDAGPPPPALEVTLRAKLVDGGVLEVPLDSDRQAELDPAVRLELQANLLLRNPRIRIFDEADRALISDDGLEDSPDGTRYRIDLGAPLKSGHRYAVVIDPETGSELVDQHGRSHPEQRLELRVSGEKEKPPPPPPQRKRRRR